MSGQKMEIDTAGHAKLVERMEAAVERMETARLDYVGGMAEEAERLDQNQAYIDRAEKAEAELAEAMEHLHDSVASHQAVEKMLREAERERDVARAEAARFKRAYGVAFRGLNNVYQCVKHVSFAAPETMAAHRACANSEEFGRIALDELAREDVKG